MGKHTKKGLKLIIIGLALYIFSQLPLDKWL